MLNDAVLHDCDGIADGHRLLLIMGDIDGGDADILLGVADHASHLQTKLGIQIRQWFIHQQNVRGDDQRPGQRNTLLLAAGELVGHTLGKLHDLHQI